MFSSCVQRSLISRVKCDENSAMSKFAILCLDSILQDSEVQRLTDAEVGALACMAAIHDARHVVHILSPRITNAIYINGFGSPLNFAASYGRLEICKTLIGTHGFDPKIKSRAGWTALSWAVRMGHFDVCKYLIDSWGVDANQAVGDDDTPPLIYALEAKHDRIALLLMDKGADVNATTTKHKIAPLHTAVSCSTVGMVENLILRGANIRAVDDGRDSFEPIHYAAQDGKLECLKMLIKHGADPYAKTKKAGRTPADISVEFKRADIMAYFLKASPRVSVAITTVDTADVCPICMSPKTPPLLVLACGHSFHSTCVRDWLSDGKTCPVCRV